MPAVAVLFVMLLMVSCKPGIPGKYLQPDEMADILYEYHLAEGIAQTRNSGDTIAVRTYRASILKHKGISQADFDSSMVYYTRHTELLEDVYTKLADRFDKESVALGGASVGDGESYTSADTANVWRQSTAFVLSPYAATNRLSFDIKADSSYHAGDKLILDFDAQFIYQDGMRDASVVLAVTYDNDSVEYVNNSVMSSSHYHLQISNTGMLGIKSVRGFWILSNGGAADLASSTTLKVLVVYNVRLVRLHAKDEKPAGQQPDGASSPDSLHKTPTDSMPAMQGRMLPRPSNIGRMPDKAL